MQKLQIDNEIKRRVVLARNQLAAAERELDAHVFEVSGLSKGDILRHVHTGNHYRLDGAFAYLSTSSGEVHLTLRCTRVYQTGRRPARADTHLSFSDVEVLKKNAS